MAAADKLDNARTLLAGLDREGSRAWEHRGRPPRTTFWFYGSVGELLAERYPAAANVALLERIVAELAAWVPPDQLARPA